MKKKPKIGLALGGGGPKGLAHVGVIKVLEKNNIPIDYIAGTSIGALVGGFYAVNKNIKEVEEKVLGVNKKLLFSLIDPTLKHGLITGKKIEEFIGDFTKQKSFNELSLPFSAIATNIKTGEPVCLNQGEISPAIRASISIPLLFKPLKKDGKTLIDGALSMPVPVEIARKMGADIVIAVNLDAGYYVNNYNNKLSFYKIAHNSIRLLRYHLAEHNTIKADITVKPDMGIVYWNKFLKPRDIIKKGEEAMEKQINKIK